MFWPIIGLKCRFRAAVGRGHTFAPDSHKANLPLYQTQGVPRTAPARGNLDALVQSKTDVPILGTALAEQAEIL